MKKAAKRKKKKNSFIIPLFWVAFAAVIILLFIVNLPLIRRTIGATDIGERIPGLTPVIGEGAVEEEPVEQIAPVISEEDYPSLEDALVHLNDAMASTEHESARDDPVAEAGAWERAVFFMRVDSDGVLVRAQEMRQVQNSPSPLLDTVNTLLGGTTEVEKARGVTTLIPAGTVLINAAMRGNTAVLNFNENFMFNSYGAEGYLAQLRQIIWTATEFPGVRNVQFLVEGQRIDFLGDNIRLDQPISREDLGHL
jgi:hypothetical protein